jgi:CBS domain
VSGPQLRRSTVADVMTGCVLSVRPAAPFAEIARVLFTAAVRAVPVLDGTGQLLGAVSEADPLVTAERGEPDQEAHWWRRRPRHVTQGSAERTDHGGARPVGDDRAPRRAATPSRPWPSGMTADPGHGA